MRRVMGVINLVNEYEEMEELTYGRCVASVPFAGRYRLVDFMLSSMVNSGISNVAIFAHTKYRSLMDHLGSGKEWDLDRKRSGLFILPPAVDEMQDMLKGDLFHFHRHRDYFYRSPDEYVIVARSHMVCNIDFTKVVDAHRESGADVTLVYKDTDEQTNARCRRLVLNDEGRVTAMQDHQGRLATSNVSMEVFVLRKDLLLDLVQVSLSEGYDHFVRNAIMRNVDRLRIHGYKYEGYLGVVNTIMSYYQHSMKLLNPEVYRDLFFTPGLIYTKVKDEPPTKYLRSSSVGNALIANGCHLEGSVENSILFRGVKVRKGAKIKNCIIMQNCEIGEYASIENAILDKDVLVGRGRDLLGDLSAPFIAAKRRII
ncbi:glucose-1-phosphate adenylyltransferase subunit GlgD [Paenibacillus koleovorans]|uniref:glucose-1-phosphate adenylyltransferase subunit GlgD n=1 Tax=Paenibacillus koleovorans TaxID=121608 RepID=UPI000FDA4E70|nr:glucose-1-phosphate adenylyltransferase subunit GlgD [Paenibacillus koleovorans]